MNDAIDNAIKATDPEPQAIRLDVNTGSGKPPIVVILPVPITEIDLFRLSHYLSSWYAEQERARLAQEPKLVLAPANVALPPPPSRPRGH